MRATCHCSFCGKGNTETELMLAGMGSVFMCAECVVDAGNQVAETIATRKRDQKFFADARQCAMCIPFPIACDLPGTSSDMGRIGT